MANHCFHWMEKRKEQHLKGHYIPATSQWNFATPYQKAATAFHFNKNQTPYTSLSVKYGGWERRHWGVLPKSPSGFSIKMLWTNEDCSKLCGWCRSNHRGRVLFWLAVSPPNNVQVVFLSCEMCNDHCGHALSCLCSSDPFLKPFSLCLHPKRWGCDDQI